MVNLNMHVQMRYDEFTVDPSSNLPLVILHEATGTRTLPMWLTPMEAMLLAQVDVPIPEPLPATHLLMTQVLDLLEAHVKAVTIDDMIEGVLHAQLIVNDGAKDLQIKCRAADALILALLSPAPIYAHTNLLQKVCNIRAHAIHGETQEDLVTTSGTALRQQNPASLAMPTSSHSKKEKTWMELLRRMHPVSPHKN